MCSHTGEKAFACSVCDYSGINKKHLKRHMWYHKDKQTSACPECEYRGNELKEHMLSHKREERLMCSECDYTCTSKAKYEAHIMKHRNGDYVDIVIAAESFKAWITHA